MLRASALITQDLVDDVHKSLKKEAAATVIPTPLPQEPPKAPPSTGSKQDIERIISTRKVCEELVEELLRERQAFESDQNTWKPNLLNHVNGKTNWKTFHKIVATRLGDKPHRDAAREVWKKVPAKYIHPGRMPE